MLRAYIDDSGWDGRSPVFILAGYVAPIERWEAFSKEWQSALDQSPAIPRMKMVEAMLLQNRNSPFYKWSDADRDEKVRLLLSVVNKHALVAVVSVVDLAAYRKHIVGRLDQPYHDRPYFFSYHGLISGLVKYLDKMGIEDRIDFVFDEQGGESTAEITAQWNSFISYAPEHLRKYIGNRPTWAREESALPLQAADVLAWNLRRYRYDQARGMTFNPPWQDELVNIERVHREWHDDDLKKAASFILRRRSDPNAKP